MTRRRSLERHRASLAEIRDIMNSMKTLAYMETRKLARFLAAQHAVVKSIEDVAADLLSFYPEALPQAMEIRPVYLLIGSERGFCGDFNHALLRSMESNLRANPPGEPMLIAIGRKLYTLLEDDARVVGQIDGANVVEEVASVAHQLVGELSSLQEHHHMLPVHGIHHDDEGNIVVQELLPPFRHYSDQGPNFAYPPILNQSPRELLAELTDHYLFAALHKMLFTSLMAENHHRVTHLEAAVKHLDSQSSELARKCHALRQEEIIEEIEVILLSATSLEESWQRR